MSFDVSHAARKRSRDLSNVTCIAQVILPGELTFGFGHASKIDQAGTVSL